MKPIRIETLTERSINHLQSLLCQGHFRLVKKINMQVNCNEIAVHIVPEYNSLEEVNNNKQEEVQDCPNPTKG